MHLQIQPHLAKTEFGSQQQLKCKFLGLGFGQESYWRGNYEASTHWPVKESEEFAELRTKSSTYHGFKNWKSAYIHVPVLSIIQLGNLVQDVQHDQKYSASRSSSRVACSSVRASLHFSKTCGVLLWSRGVCRSFKALSSRTAFHWLFCAKPLMAELVPTSSAKMSGVSSVYLVQVDTICTLVRLSILCLLFYLIGCSFNWWIVFGRHSIGLFT